MRRAALPAAALAGFASLLFAQPQEAPQVEAPGVPAVTILNPDAHVRLAAQFVATRTVHRLFGDQDLPYVRFISFFDTPPGLLEKDTAFLDWWVQQMSFETATEPVKPVPGSNGRLFWLDLRDYKWNPGAWRAVAERDNTFLEPWIDHEHAEYLRRALYAPPSEKALRGREILSTPDGRPERVLVLPAGTVVYGPQFLRDTLETDRTPNYYDLLFARFRFVGEGWCPTGKKLEKVKVTKTIDHPGGDYTYPDGRVVKAVAPGRYDVEFEEVRQGDAGAGGGFRFVEFPKDEDDFEAAFGIDKLKVFARESEIDLDFGAVVEGGGDFPGSGSVVARQNRLLVMINGPFGWYGETYDVKKTSGVRNFNEALVFGQGKHFKPGRGAVAVRDAGEILATLPNGGLAGILIDGRGKRIELAGAQFANDTADSHMNPGVRTFGSCAVCHGAAGGFIPPKDAIREGLDKGVDVKFKDKAQRNRVRAFFLGWEAKIKGMQAPYEGLLSRMTKGAKGRGWKGADLAKYVTDFRHRYDAPVDSAAAAAHVGIPVAVFHRIAEHGLLNGPKRMVQGLKVPRTAWDEDYYAVIQVARQAEVDETEKRRQNDVRRRKEANQAEFEKRYLGGRKK